MTAISSPNRVASPISLLPYDLGCSPHLFLLMPLLPESHWVHDACSHQCCDRHSRFQAALSGPLLGNDSIDWWAIWSSGVYILLNLSVGMSPRGFSVFWEAASISCRLCSTRTALKAAQTLGCCLCLCQFNYSFYISLRSRIQQHVIT